MSPLSIPASTLLQWNDTVTTHWMTLLNEQPAIFNLPCDIRASGTVSRLLQHIMAVELRYAQRLAAIPESSYEAIPFGSAGELHATHAHAMQIIESLLNDPVYDWSIEIEFQTISAGRMRSARQAIFIHALMHSMHHYAQLATLIRQHGIKAVLPMDYILMASTPA